MQVDSQAQSPDRPGTGAYLQRNTLELLWFRKRDAGEAVVQVYIVNWWKGEQRNEIKRQTKTVDEKERGGEQIWRKGSVTHRDIGPTTLGNKLYLSWKAAQQLQAQERGDLHPGGTRRIYPFVLRSISLKRPGLSPAETDTSTDLLLRALVTLWRDVDSQMFGSYVGARGMLLIPPE